MIQGYTKPLVGRRSWILGLHMRSVYTDVKEELEEIDNWEWITPLEAIHNI